MHLRSDVDRPERFESLAKMTDVPEYEDVNVKKLRIGSAHQLGNYSLHAAVMEIVDYVKNPSTA
jgi:hypothetical protein